MDTDLDQLGSVIHKNVADALAEDIGGGDLTSALVDDDSVIGATIVARQSLVLAGQPWVDEVFAQLDGRVVIDWYVSDGGTADGTSACLLDTRKTLPGLRHAQKYAVRCGGGKNHRVGLFDAILIKENHIKSAGGIGKALAKAREAGSEVLIEIEVESQEELLEALDAGATRILLDNFSIDDLSRAVDTNDGYGYTKAELEASGNVTLESIRDVALTGVDYISTGAITKNIEAIDLSMLFRID